MMVLRESAGTRPRWTSSARRFSSVPSRAISSFAICAISESLASVLSKARLASRSATVFKYVEPCATSSFSRAYSFDNSWMCGRKSIREKNIRPQSDEAAAGGRAGNPLLLFLLRGGGGGGLGLGGLRLGQALLEFVHATGGVHKLLLAGVKRVADIADTDQNRRLGGAGLDHIAAGATDFRIHILRMNVGFHNKGRTTYHPSAG